MHFSQEKGTPTSKKNRTRASRPFTADASLRSQSDKASEARILRPGTSVKTEKSSGEQMVLLSQTVFVLKIASAAGLFCYICMKHFQRQGKKQLCLKINKKDLLPVVFICSVERNALSVFFGSFCCRLGA